MTIDAPPDAVCVAAPADAGAIKAVAAVLAETGAVNDPAWIAATRAAWEDVPSSIRRTVRGFRRHSGRSGVLQLRGLPVVPECLPPTPMTSGSRQRQATMPTSLLMLLACGLGDSGAFRADKSGALVQDVVPVPGSEEFQSNEGSSPLSLHTENAFHPFRPDFVLLLCLRVDHDRRAALRTASIRTVLPTLSEKERRLLFEADFETRTPSSFGPVSGSVRHAVLSGDPVDPDLRVDFVATKALTPTAAQALDHLRMQLEHASLHAYLDPGDLAIVDNRVTVHGRTAFQPRYDGHDRWLQRTFAFTDLCASRSCRQDDGHVLD